MTIKQQGGVFGRNPTFNDVDANSVTADQATINGTVLADEVGVNTSPSYPLHVVRDTAGFIAGFRNSDATTLARTIAAGNSLGDLVTAVLANTGHAVIYSDSGKTLALGANGSTTAALTVNTDQTVSFRENLIIANGKGIDFSATAGAGTSELFDDYEEGTWTPAWTNLTVGNGTSTGRYTKFGRNVFVEVDLLLGSTTVVGSNPEINNIPFASAADFQSFGGGSLTDAGTNTDQASCLVVANSNRLLPFRYNISGSRAYQATLSATTPFTWAANDRIRLSVAYTAAG